VRFPRSSTGPDHERPDGATEDAGAGNGGNGEPGTAPFDPHERIAPGELLRNLRRGHYVPRSRSRDFAKRAVIPTMPGCVATASSTRSASAWLKVLRGQGSRLPRRRTPRPFPYPCSRKGASQDERGKRPEGAFAHAAWLIGGRRGRPSLCCGNRPADNAISPYVSKPATGTSPSSLLTARTAVWKDAPRIRFRQMQSNTSAPAAGTPFSPTLARAAARRALSI
jgi:hypothetical protein